MEIYAQIAFTLAAYLFSTLPLVHGRTDDGGMVGDPGNLSDEFRTLVTSIRVPLEDELADSAALPAARRERLKGLQRNFMRLFQLVNTLFDLSHVEVRRRQGPEQVDLAATTVVLPLLRSRASQRRDQQQQQPPPERSAGSADSLELERATQELEAFRYSVSHDLRGPLRAVDGFSQVLLNDYAQGLDRGGRELLEQIHASARRMSAIVDDMLALSQLGKDPLRREFIDLTALARRIVADLRQHEPSRVVEISVADGMIATGDARLVVIILENLFANAWKFTRKRPDAKIVFYREAGGVFAVRDNGVGFEMSRSEHLFELFQRLHSSSEFEGTGIGLAIVRRAIERHGGRVWAHGVVDRGATIRFTLECDEVTRSQVRSAG